MSDERWTGSGYEATDTPVIMEAVGKGDSDEVRRLLQE